VPTVGTPTAAASELASILTGPGARVELAQRAADAIRRAGAFDWVGLYDVTPTTITAIAWTGREAPAFPSFPRTQGLNGAAVAARLPIVVNDVATDPRYLTTFARTGAEMIVPVTDDEGAAVGTIDVESARVGAFGPSELSLVEECARILRPLWLR
jgi:GAF domain-containing protein